MQDRLEIVRLLIKHGADVHARSTIGETPLLSAAHSGTKEAIQFFIAQGSDINELDNYGYTALHFACLPKAKQGFTMVFESAVKQVEILCKAGADVNIYSKDKARSDHSSSEEHPAPQLTPLLLLYDSLNTIGFSSDTIGITSNDGNQKKYFAQIAELLLQYKAKINDTDKDGRTVLHKVAYLSEPRAMRILLNCKP